LEHSVTNPVQRIVIKFKPASGAEARTLAELCDQVAEIVNGVLIRPPSATGRAVFQLKASADLDRLVQEVKKLPFVEYAEPDVLDRAQ
jgi:hypothetical protein